MQQLIVTMQSILSTKNNGDSLTFGTCILECSMGIYSLRTQAYQQTK